MTPPAPAFARIPGAEGGPKLQSHDAARALRESDRRFRGLVEAMAEIVWRIKPDGTTIESSGWTEFTGQSLDDLAANGWDSSVHPQDKALVHAAWARAMASTTPFEMVSRIRGRSGEYRWFRTQAAPVLDDAGAVLEWVGLTADIDEEHRVDEALQRANEKLRAIIATQAEMAAVGITRSDLKRIITDRVRTLMPSTELLGVATPSGEDLEYPGLLGAVPYEAALRFHRHASLTGWCFEHRQSLRCDDMAADTRASMVGIAAVGVRSTIMAPLITRGEIIGVLSAFSRQPAAFTDEDLRTLELLAGLLAAALANAKANEERQLLLAERTAALDRLRSSEELFRSITEHSDEMINIIAADGTTKYSSPSVFRVLGWTPQELLGTNPVEFVHEEDRDTMRNSFEELLSRSGRSSMMMVRMRHKDGSWRYLEGNGRNLLHVPSVAGIVATARDVTERVQTQKAIEFQAQLLQTVEQAVIAWDVEGRVTHWNRFAEAMMGWRADEVMGNQAQQFLAPEGATAEAHAEAQKILAHLLSGRSWKGEIEVRRRDGSAFTIEVCDTPIYDTAGKVSGFVSVGTDVTQRRQLEEQLRQAQKMEAIGQLAGGVAHDFNNILTAITSYSELLLDDVGESPMRADLVEIRQAARRAADLTKQLLAFSRRQVLQVEVLDLAAVVRDMEGMLRRLISEDIILDTTYPESPIMVRADRAQLEQVIMNLVVNARDALPANGQIRVAVESEAHAGKGDSARALLRVVDNGSGIPPEVLSRIFEPFFTTKEPGKGTGLGLSVVYGIIDQLGGTIAVDSEEGTGTTFRILLPVVREAARAADSESRPLIGGDETILLVEDNEALVDLSQRILAQLGYTVLAASTTVEALRLAGAHAVDVVVTDVVMPVMSGPALIAHIRASGKDPKVLYMSGYTEEAIPQRRTPSDGTAFLPKPWTPRELGSAVRDLIDSAAAQAA
ncbi:MAG: PAS domain S-box protein [Gemmatimonadaceae bacterium]